MSDAELVRAQCAECSGARNCSVLAEHLERGDEEHYQWRKHWRVLQCRGCNHVFAQTVSSNSEDLDHYYNEQGEAETIYHETVEYFPAVSRRNRPEWLSAMGVEGAENDGLSEIMTELYKALDADLSILAVTGIRTAFDAASGQLGISTGLSFRQKLDRLVQERHVRDSDRARLEVLVDAGSAAAHRGWRPDQTAIGALIEVLESFVYGAIVSPARNRRLDDRVRSVSIPARNGLT